MAETRVLNVGSLVADKNDMVRLWAATVREMPEVRSGAHSIGELEDDLTRCYDGYAAAMRGEFRRLQSYISEKTAERSRRNYGTGDVLRTLWSFRDVAVAYGWSNADVVRLDEVICQATSAFAEALGDLHTRQGYLSVLKSLAVAMEEKDRYTSCHCQAVQQIGEVIAADLGVDIGYAGLFHDLGKLHVPDHILRKRGRLTTGEYDIVKQHSVHAYRMLAPLPAPLRSVVLRHHERPDGRGYPLGLTEVPLTSAVIAVADTLHAICSDRPYRSARPFEEALEIINEVKGTQLREEPVAAAFRARDILRDVDHCVA